MGLPSTLLGTGIFIQYRPSRSLRRDPDAEAVDLHITQTAGSSFSLTGVFQEPVQYVALLDAVVVGGGEDLVQGEEQLGVVVRDPL